MDSGGSPIDHFSDSSKAISLGQDLSRCVLRCKLGLTIHRPLNTDSRIASQQTALMLRVPVVCRLVQKLGRLAGHHSGVMLYE